MVTKIVAPANLNTVAESPPFNKGWMRTAADHLIGLPWDFTAEGFEFWQSVYYRLLAIADGEPLK